LSALSVTLIPACVAVRPFAACWFVTNCVIAERQVIGIIAVKDTSQPPVCCSAVSSFPDNESAYVIQASVA